jgi:hypothetical protein
MDDIREAFPLLSRRIFCLPIQAVSEKGNFLAAKYQVDIILDAESGSAGRRTLLSKGFSGLMIYPRVPG